MGFEPSTPHACTIMRDEGTMSIVSAFTRPTARGHGVGAALLERGLAAARAAGYVRCAVDFESANIEGARFWMRYFQPICYSVVRVIDPRMGWAGADREAQNFW
jgi:GNAT superfamily N-acetyltransferase